MIRTTNFQQSNFPLRCIKRIFIVIAFAFLPSAYELYTQLPILTWKQPNSGEVKNLSGMVYEVLENNKVKYAVRDKGQSVFVYCSIPPLDNGECLKSFKGIVDLIYYDYYVSY